VTLTALVAGNATLTWTQIRGGLLHHAANAAGADTLTLPTAALLVQNLLPRLNDSVSFTLRNTGSGVTTLAAGSGDSFSTGASQAATVRPGEYKVFRLRATTVTASSEAVAVDVVGGSAGVTPFAVQAVKAPVALSDADATLTAAQVVGGVLSLTTTADTPRVLTLPTAANLITELNLQKGAAAVATDCFYFSLRVLVGSDPYKSVVKLIGNTGLTLQPAQYNTASYPVTNNAASWKVLGSSLEACPKLYRGYMTGAGAVTVEPVGFPNSVRVHTYTAPAGLGAATVGGGDIGALTFSRGSFERVNNFVRAELDYTAAASNAGNVASTITITGGLPWRSSLFLAAERVQIGRVVHRNTTTSVTTSGTISATATAAGEIVASYVTPAAANAGLVALTFEYQADD
jgi:hypothetical protein